MRALSVAVLGLFLLLLSGRAAASQADDAAALKTAQEAFESDYSSGDFAAARQRVQARAHALRVEVQPAGAGAPARPSRDGRVAARTEARGARAVPDGAAARPERAAAAADDAGHPRAVGRHQAGGQGRACGRARRGEPTDQPAAEPTPQGAPRAAHIPGWSNVDAFQEASAGLAADMAGKLTDCIDHDTKSLGLEEQPRTRLHLSSCEARTGHLLDALRDAQKALEDGIHKRDPAVMKAARERVEGLLRRVPHVTFQLPVGVENLVVTFDDRAVPVAALSKHFSIDPGDHKLHAEGTQSGIPLALDATYQVGEGQLLTVQLVLKSQAPEYLTPGQLKCMLAAKNQDDVVRCLPQKTKPLVVKAGSQLSAYGDTTNVYVWSPEIDATVSSPTQGVERRRALPGRRRERGVPGHRERGIPAVQGAAVLGRAHGRIQARHLHGQGQVNYSGEPDYISRGAGIAFTADLNDKLITPRLAINYSHDNIGRGPNNFIQELDTTDLEAGVTLVVSPTSLLLVSTTLQLENGDQSKPYRYVPMFDPVNVAPYIPVGASVALVNAERLPFKPTEQLPLSRTRFAVGARFAHRFPGATLRLEQRLYSDSWALKATTTDARYVVGSRPPARALASPALQRANWREFLPARVFGDARQHRDARHPDVPHDGPRAVPARHAHGRRRGALHPQLPRGQDGLRGLSPG